ncbi:MBL fold metallo-hydrolase [Psychroserpens sp.]|uniref:MBL fold metallo-hydrolase n=1 Tax=Psychroserpens sp. TaxID=2020870 RepID=UPI001B27B28E|nr:MBL fold metallo-hydrolase [Psychroserpens sp.]MBO6606561.1 MBL fold metallo-hydrolase [Psychroserpens sp.]MBO6631305.1 MBL fold metallo-hydrolase [Psychroserpens sp.]MBO6653265.1 MBL fold metallo-hydrolase [Psychroserpens sp.]MBO6680708.1 MBL fold metallo-hydrolase [Psychroserpens sp.]MBO6750334.1 MBL fold metallo-hydrolase [Psychroserpens sp.]
MKITFLGTGTSQGIPIIGSDHPVCLSSNPKDKRLRVSVLVEWDDYTYVVDCGPDFRQQMLRAGVKRIDGIVFTHEHADHTAGLDDIRPFYFRQGDIPFYAHKRVFQQLRERFDYIFTDKDKYPGVPSVIQNEIRNEPFQLNSMTVVPINGYHHKLQVFGFRFNEFAYLTDMKTVADEEIEKLKDVKVLVVNALRETEHISHFNLKEALDFIDRVKPEKAYLTHISHHMGFHDVVQQSLPENVYLAYDNLQIHV